MLSRVRSAPRRIGAGIRLRGDRLGVAAHATLLLAGLAAGLLLALPVADVEDRCPPRGEGYDFCVVQKAWLPTLLIVLAGVLLAQVLAKALLVRLPAWRERIREVGERRVGMDETREDPPYSSDPFLLASTWGTKEGRSDRRRPSILERLRRR